MQMFVFFFGGNVITADTILAISRASIDVELLIPSDMLRHWFGNAHDTWCCSVVSVSCAIRPIFSGQETHIAATAHTLECKHGIDLDAC